MLIISTFFVILIVSFLLALRSMRDFDVPVEIRKQLSLRRIRGRFVFFRDAIHHYSSSSSSSSST